MVEEPTNAAALAPARSDQSWRTRLWKYVEVTKPSTVALLVFTCVGAMVAAGGVGTLSLAGWVTALVAITAGCAAADTLTCYIDRDIDALMDRTRSRPLPGKRISPPEKALVWGLFLAAGPRTSWAARIRCSGLAFCISSLRCGQHWPRTSMAS